jgi:hypothetical protein
MSEFIKTKIEIGGNITFLQSAAIYEEAKKEVLSLEWDDGDFSHDEMIKQAEDDSTITFCGSCRNGEIIELETFLKDEGIPFLKEIDSYLDFEGGLVKFDGKETSTSLSNISGNPMIEESIISSAVDALKNMDFKKTLEILEAALFDNSIPPLTIKKEACLEDEEKLFIIDANHDTEEYPTFCGMYTECDPGYTRAPLEVYWDRISDMMEELPAEEAKKLEDEYNRVAKRGNYIQVVE